MGNTVYIISGPAGAGKSTTSRILASLLPRSAYIEGDLIDRMVVGGHEKPWLSDYHTGLIWRNMKSLASNFLDEKHDVVIDYVAFPRNAEEMASAFEERGDVTVKYAVLVPKEDELLRRDAQRQPEARMGMRCLAGLQEIRDAKPDPKHLLDTTDIPVEKVVRLIMSKPEFEIGRRR
jgi:hypothetical protein